MVLRNGKKRVNLRDVAKAADVSIATASRVLNAPEKVRADTRERVQAKIAELGFIRSAAAHIINTGRSNILGALIPTIDSDIFAQTIDAVENQLDKHGFSLVVATTDDDREIEARKAQELLDIGVEGLFLTGVTHSDGLHNLIRRTGVPSVAISYYDAGYHLPTIGYDNEEAARTACKHLADNGHARIAVIHGPRHNNDRTRARIQGATRVRADVELTFFETELSITGGSSAAVELLQSKQTFDAILCVSDVLAYGAIFEIHRAGLEIPKAYSVMSIHDLPASNLLVPRLSTIRLPAQDMGVTAAQALVDWVLYDERPKHILLPLELIERESVATQRK